MKNYSKFGVVLFILLSCASSNPSPGSQERQTDLGVESDTGSVGEYLERTSEVFYKNQQVAQAVAMAEIEWSNSGDIVDLCDRKTESEFEYICGLKDGTQVFSEPMLEIFPMEHSLAAEAYRVELAIFTWINYERNPYDGVSNLLEVESIQQLFSAWDCIANSEDAPAFPIPQNGEPFETWSDKEYIQENRYDLNISSSAQAAMIAGCAEELGLLHSLREYEEYYESKKGPWHAYAE